MTLTQRINAPDVPNNNERWKIICEAREAAEKSPPSDFYVAIPVNMAHYCFGWAVFYTIGMPNPGGGSRWNLMAATASHSTPHDMVIVGEEQALDFVYMLNMARINRKDGS